MKNFPQYRKYKGRTTWIKILSENEWNELRVMGNYYTVSSYKTITFTDRNQLNDILENSNGFLEEITGLEYTEKLKECENSKTLNNSL